MVGLPPEMTVIVPEVDSEIHVAINEICTRGCSRGGAYFLFSRRLGIVLSFGDESRAFDRTAVKLAWSAVSIYK